MSRSELLIYKSMLWAQISARSIVIVDFSTMLQPLAKAVRTVVRGPLMSHDETDHQEVAFLREVNVFGYVLLSQIQQLPYRCKLTTCGGRIRLRRVRLSRRRNRPQTHRISAECDVRIHWTRHLWC